MINNRPVPLGQLITITATDGLMLPALYYRPDAPTKRLAIWLHGMGTSGSFYAVDRTNALAAAFASHHTALLALNNRGAHLAQGVKFLDDDGQLQKRTVGTSHELINDCSLDIEGALVFAKQHGYNELFLVGHSTGANKVCVYNFYNPDNPFAGYVLFGGGDDTGLFYQEMGEAKFHQMLRKCQEQIGKGRGGELVPLSYGYGIFSYASLYDILNPDGDSNTFPYLEAQSGTELSSQPLFRHFAAITKPTLVIYGELDSYCRPSAQDALEVLKRYANPATQMKYELVPGANHGATGKEADLARRLTDWVGTIDANPK